MLASSNRKQVEVLSEISHIIVKLSDGDLERMESVAEQITSFDPELGGRILDAYALLTHLNDDVETALERIEPDTKDIEDKEAIGIAEIEAHETDAEDQEEAGKEQGKIRRKRQK
jgi:hypothetical protein